MPEPKYPTNSNRSLETLLLYDNGLRGTIPSSIGSCNQLSYLGTELDVVLYRSRVTHQCHCPN